MSGSMEMGVEHATAGFPRGPDFNPVIVTEFPWRPRGGDGSAAYSGHGEV